MSLLNGKQNNFFGMDIGSTAVRVVQLVGSGSNKSLKSYAYMPIDPKQALSDSKADQQKMSAAIKSLVNKAGLNTKNVAVNLPSNKVFTTVVDVERLSKEELVKSIKYQADSLIPTPIAESKIDWTVLGDSPQDKTKVELLLSSVPNNYAESRLDLLEAIGLNVIAFEPDVMALTRAVIDPLAQDTQIIIDMGHNSTDIVVITNGNPRLSRSIPTGYEAIIKAASQNLNIDEAQARQFVNKFGLNEQKLEGQIYHAVSGTVDLLAVEIDKSIKFFNARYPDRKLDKMVVVGGASILPEFPLYLANRFKINVEISDSWRNVSYAADRRNELAAISNQFAVAVGLAERNE